MAIQLRRGVLADFDKSKMVEGEIAITKEGEAYYCYMSGQVKKFTTQEDVLGLLNITAEELEWIIELLENEQAVVNIIEEINQAGQQNLTSINNTASAKITAIESEGDKVLQSVSTGVSQITSARDSAISSIDSASSASIQAVNDAGQQSISEITNTTTSKILEINESASGKLTQMESLKNQTQVYSESAKNSADSSLLNASNAEDSAASAEESAKRAESAIGGGYTGLTPVEFTESASRDLIETNENIPTLFGKILKWLNDLKQGAFHDVSNVLTETLSGKVLDARQGKVLNDKIEAIGQGGTGTSDHSELTHLTFVESGHIGFQAELSTAQLDNIADVPNKADTTELSQAVSNHNSDTNSHKTLFDSKVSNSEITELIASIGYNATTGVMTITKVDGSSVIIDFPVENIISSGSFDTTTNEIVLVFVSGEEIRIPASSLIDEYTGEDTTTIAMTVQENKINAVVKNGSITNVHLSETINTLLGTLQTQTHTHANKAILDTIDENSKFTDTVYNDTSVRELIQGNTTSIESKENISAQITYTSAEITTGINLLDNQEISITESVVTFNILTAPLDGACAITFVADDGVVITIPEGTGWGGGEPTFEVGKVYNIAYYKGTFYADGGR